jgi:hypothetical protein
MDMQKEIDGIAVTLIALRAVMARLLAHEAARYDDPNQIFRDISEGMDKMLARHSSHAATIDLEEGVKKEIDWLIAASRSLL